MMRKVVSFVVIPPMFIGFAAAMLSLPGFAKVAAITFGLVSAWAIIAIVAYTCPLWGDE